MIIVGKEKIPWKEGLTVKDLLASISDPYPYAVIRMNGKLISRPNFEKTKVPDQAEVILIPMIAGG